MHNYHDYRFLVKSVDLGHRTAATSPTALCTGFGELDRVKNMDFLGGFWKLCVHSSLLY